MSNINNTTSRPNAPQIKVVGVGLGRTGTLSLCSALETLGFGPCYHPLNVSEDRRNWGTWARIAEGDASPEILDLALQDFHSVVDSPGAIRAAELYSAYPDAKFILTIRDPAKWEKSIKETTLPIYEFLKSATNLPPAAQDSLRWSKGYFDGYHGGRLWTQAQQEIIEHNERVKGIIPSEKLLIYNIGEGWSRLCEFLNVPEPSVSFPHLNETAQIQDFMRREYGAKAAGSIYKIE